MTGNDQSTSTTSSLDNIFNHTEKITFTNTISYTNTNCLSGFKWSWIRETPDSIQNQEGTAWCMAERVGTSPTQVYSKQTKKPS